MGNRPRALAGIAAVAMAVAGCGGDGGGDGKTLALGDSATVDYVTTASGDTPAVNTKLEVTVLAVRKGTQEELADGGMKVEPEAKDATPYYVDARYANKGSEKVKRTLGVSMEDADGNSIPTTLIFGLSDEKFEPCVNVNEGTLAPGQSYEGCTLFLVPKGASVETVRFVSQDAKAKITFTDWKAEKAAPSGY